MSKKPAIIENDIEASVQVLASAIVAVSEAARKIALGPLQDRAVELLIQDGCGGRVSRHDIRQVLDVAATLETRYVKPKKKAIT